MMRCAEVVLVTLWMLDKIRNFYLKQGHLSQSYYKKGIFIDKFHQVGSWLQ